jgi:hypothetical protein
MVNDVRSRMGGERPTLHQAWPEQPESTTTLPASPPTHGVVLEEGGAAPTPAGLPYLSVQPGSDGLFSPGETLTVVLEFAGKVPKRYRPTFRIVARAGAR